MNWTKLLHRIPERVRIGVGGMLLAVGFIGAPRMIAAWLRFWF